VRTHKIVDGDTLTSLAARYLGDGRRSGEVYEANRGVLPSPDTLPIGVTLKIPPRCPPAGDPAGPAAADTPAPPTPDSP
jgi:nucleoid-associated protein YgaU